MNITVISKDASLKEELQEMLNGKISIKAINFDKCPKSFTQLIKKNSDLLFWDIGEEKDLGFLIKYKKSCTNVNIIFILRRKNCLINIFDLFSIDYILKPLMREKITEIIERKRLLLEENHSVLSKVALLRDKRMYLVNIRNIMFLYVENGVIQIITEQKSKYKSKQTLKYWEKRLNSFSFFQCHKSFLVNMEKVKEVVPYFNNTYVLKFEGDFPEVPVSRNYIKKFKQFVGL